MDIINPSVFITATHVIVIAKPKTLFSRYRSTIVSKPTFPARRLWCVKMPFRVEPIKIIGIYN